MGENLYGKGQKVLSDQGRKHWDDIRWDSSAGKKKKKKVPKEEK